MNRGWAVALSACAVVAATSTARADVSIGAGFENFAWKESTNPRVKEQGLRFVFDLTWSQTREPGPSFEYNIKTYVGNVDYTGAFLVSNAPLSGETHYRGVANEFRAVYRTVGGADVTLAGGWDHWNRDLSAAQKETYDVFYARLGAGFGSMIRQGVFGNVGVKIPAYVRENAHFTDFGFTTNPRLRPRGHVSAYGTLGYRVNPGWDVMAYYDSYRFGQSNTVAVSGSGFGGSAYQPKSKQDQIGMKIQHNF